MKRKTATSSCAFRAIKNHFHGSFQNHLCLLMKLHVVSMDSALLPLLCCFLSSPYFPLSLSAPYSWLVVFCYLTHLMTDLLLPAEMIPLEELGLQVCSTMPAFLRGYRRKDKSCPEISEISPELIQNIRRQIMKEILEHGGKGACGLSRMLWVWRTGWLLYLWVSSQAKSYSWRLKSLLWVKNLLKPANKELWKFHLWRSFHKGLDPSTLHLY